MKHIPYVVNMASPKSGLPVANQYIISVNGVGTFFQSYQTIIAGKTPDGVVLDNGETSGWGWNASRTTGKYRNEFLGENTQETRRKIKSGEYKLLDLNK